MKLRCIEMVMDDEDSWEGDFKCPACECIWLECRDGGGVAYNTSCDHIRFICLSEDKIVCFNDLTLRDLNAAISPPLPPESTNPVTTLKEPNASSLNDHILENCNIPNFWRRVKPETVNALFYFGDNHGRILFGARFDPPLPETTDAGF